MKDVTEIVINLSSDTVNSALEQTIRDIRASYVSRVEVTSDNKEMTQFLSSIEKEFSRMAAMLTENKIRDAKVAEIQRMKEEKDAQAAHKDRLKNLFLDIMCSVPVDRTL